MTGSRQLPLRFPEPALTFDTMVLSACNRGAVAAARRVQHWPYHVFCLIGPPKCGLTSLARAWAEENKGVLLAHDALAADLDIETGPAMMAIDRADQLSQDAQLLNLISALKRRNGRLLLTARTPPTQWLNSSADLASRLKSAPLAEIAPPDEPMMRARLRGAARRGFINLPQQVEDYLVPRLGLSYVAIEEMMDDLSGRMAGRELTVPLAREILDAADGQSGLFSKGDNA
ncbi:MAG: hypothetical protein AAF613_00435 [Pseudomonadota bacterium]